MSPSVNYAEQVLREEAERLAKLKEEATSATAVEAIKQKKGEESLKASIAKVNLKDEENFPTLGKAKGINQSCGIMLIFNTFAFFSYNSGLE